MTHEVGQSWAQSVGIGGHPSLKSHPLCPNPKGQGQLKIAKHFSWNTTRIKMTVTLCITQIGFWRVVRCSYEIAYICEVCTFHLWYYFENLPMKSANSGNDDDIMILQTYWNQYHRPLQTPRSGYTEPPPTEGPTPGPGAEWVSWMLMMALIVVPNHE